MNTVDKVINIALQEVGYLEKKSNAQLDDKTVNAGSANYTKYGRDMHAIYPEVMDFPAAWCDAFVDWCFYKAYGVSTAKSLLCGNFDDYTVASAQMFKNKKSYHQSNPVVGDQIFFKNAKGGICHTGLVYAVDSNYVYTIEGNTSGASGIIANGGGVCKKKYVLNYSRIDGYGRPRYDVKTTGSGTYKVVSGDTLSGIGQKTGMNWRTIADLNGIKSPYIIRVGQVLKLTGTVTSGLGKMPYKVMINTVNTGLNVRAGAGPKYKIVRSVAKGSIQSVVEEKNGWGRLADGGWICLKYVKQTS